MEFDVVRPVEFDLTIETPEIDINSITSSETVALVMVPGEAGKNGGAFDGTAWWTGEGVPGLIVGAKPGDQYIDTLTGNIYKLGD